MIISTSMPNRCQKFWGWELWIKLFNRKISLLFSSLWLYCRREHKKLNVDLLFFCSFSRISRMSYIRQALCTDFCQHRGLSWAKLGISRHQYTHHRQDLVQDGFGVSRSGQQMDWGRRLLHTNLQRLLNEIRFHF